MDESTVEASQEERRKTLARWHGCAVAVRLVEKYGCVSPSEPAVPATDAFRTYLCLPERREDSSSVEGHGGIFPKKLPPVKG